MRVMKKDILIGVALAIAVVIFGFVIPYYFPEQKPQSCVIGDEVVQDRNLCVDEYLFAE